MGLNITQKLVRAHLAEGDLTPGGAIALKIDQTLTQDATGGLVMLALEAMGLDRVQTEASVQYVDHNLLQTDNRNADDHLFLESACRRFGLHFSRPGNGVSHPVHMQRFGRPGATTSVFPSDGETRRFLESEGRRADWTALEADGDAEYDLEDEIDLSALEPLIARPSSPGAVVAVREAAGEPIYQAYIGSSANPGYRDFAMAAQIVAGRRIANGVSFDINPTSRQLLETLARDGRLAELIHAGARLHQAGCNGCIGMGQAPATGRNSLRTTPRNFPGRSGTPEDGVFLCSPETAAAAALAGRIVDPRDLDMPYPKVGPPAEPLVLDALVEPPLDAAAARDVALVKGPNIVDFPDLDATSDRLGLDVLLALGDDVSTDEIMPAGADALPYRNNIPKIADFLFRDVDPDYVAKAREARAGGGHAIVAGANYGQGSSREHAALAPRYLGLRAVLAESYARIHRQNLINFGVLPLEFGDPADRAAIEAGATLTLEGLDATLADDGGERIQAHVDGLDRPIDLELRATARDRAILRAGGLINWAAAS